MHLKKVEATHGPVVVCRKCGKSVPVCKAYADLHSVAERAFYCDLCMQVWSTRFIEPNPELTVGA